MNNEKILNKVNSTSDLKKLNKNEVVLLCDEIRKKLISTISKNGGHLSSNLGTVELTVALHRIFDSPKDQIIFDVGHQAYTHKLLTGRKDRFDTIRQKNGLSGFPNPKESEHDIVVCGHSGTSLASAFGLARAKTISGDDGYVIAVVGDGAASGGMFYEGLNNIGRYHDKIIVILNDNKVSISKNIGGVAKYLSEIRVRPKYFKAKDKIEHFISSIPYIGKWLKKKIISSKSILKFALYRNTWFEEFGFKYIGPVDGHDLDSLYSVLNRAKSLNRPVFIHVETTKGKGYKFAEENPGAYHGVKPFDSFLGSEDTLTSDGFSKQFGDYLVELAKKDNRICAITAAMKYATGLDKFAQVFPKRFLDVGIAEQMAITCAAGMAENNLVPIVSIYSSFLQRAYDQIIHDAAISNLHIVLAVDRAGIVGEDGETHQGIFDVSFLSSVPNVKIYSPSDYDELKRCIYSAIYKDNGIVVVRYPKGKEISTVFKSDNTDFSVLKSNKKSQNVVITYGRIINECLNAREKDSSLFDIVKLINISDIDKIYDIVKDYKNIFFVEESIKNGSISEKMADALIKNGFKGNYYTKNIENIFVPHQTTSEAFASLEFDAENIYLWIKDKAEQNGKEKN